MEAKRCDLFKMYAEKVIDFLLDETHNTEYTYVIQLDSDNSCSEMSADCVYLRFKILLNKAMRANFDNNYAYPILDTLTRAIAHLYTDPLFEVMDDRLINPNTKMVFDIKERQVQRIAALLYRLIPERLKKL